MIAVLRLFSFLIVSAACAACSGGGTTSPAAPTSVTGATVIAPPGTLPPSGGPLPGPGTVAITATGMTPLEISVNVGERVTFVNTDSRAHDVAGGKDPSTPECPEITMVGFLTPGRRADTGVFTRPQTCEYHDHMMMGVPAFQGRIIIR